MKNLLRIQAKLTRKNLDCAKYSSLITEKIMGWTVFKSASNIMLYHPLKNEIDLLGLMKCKDKNFYLPKMKNNIITVVKIDENTTLQKGRFGVMEPSGVPLNNLKSLDLVLIPALVADKYGYRLGYGKGCYDSFLPSLPARTVKAVIIYEELFCGEIPIESHDQKCDFVITQNQILNCRILLA